MKRLYLLLLGLLPLTLPAQVQPFPYTPQEIIALLPAVPTIEGMVAYAEGVVKEEFTTSDYQYSGNDDLTRFIKEYNLAREKYNNAFGKWMQGNTEANEKIAGNMAEAMTGRSVNELANMDKQQKEALGNDIAQQQAAMAAMNMNMDISKMQNMSEEEMIAYANQQVSAATGISEKEMKKMEKMSDRELEAYLSKPENKGKREALMKMADMGDGVTQASTVEAHITQEEAEELNVLNQQLIESWISIEAVMIEAKGKAQNLWDTEYKAKYDALQAEVAKYSMGEMMTEEWAKECAAKYPVYRKLVQDHVSDYYAHSLPDWRQSVITTLDMIKSRLDVVIRRNELELKMERTTKNNDPVAIERAEANLISRVSSDAAKYLETGENFFDYYRPEL